MKVWTGSLRQRVRQLLAGLVAGVGIAVGLFLLADQVISPLPDELLTRPAASFVYSREGRLLTAFTSSDRFWRKPVRLDLISPKLIKSVIATEDRFFYSHPGVNPVSLVKSALANIEAGRTVRGGSTITMQIARMIEPKDRTIKNKLFEIFRAIQLELRYSKTELLEIYFNLAPYGGNLEGVGAASYFYFDKRPTDLTWSEAALLTAIPASPEKFRPDRYLDQGRERSLVLLDRLYQAGVLGRDEFDAAITEDIPSRRLTIPRVAPHLAEELRTAYPDSTELTSTIEIEVQLRCEQLARSYHRRYLPRDIHNLAIVVIDNPRGEIIAQVGSPDFDDKQNSGQVDASNAPRSPGSALKPFVYGLAFDLGLLSPEMMVTDIPVNYGGYRPVNYDESYRGLISMRESLVRSLNIPAVNTASQVGLKAFHNLLQRGGLATIDRPYYEYGLPLVLGACEVRLTELTNLYATLARQGWYRPVKRLVGEDSPTAVSLLSPEACYLVSDILVNLTRPDLPGSWRSATSSVPVAWKTGTSYGRRDAWSIGYTKSHTVGIWVGNCSGAGSVDLVGASVAAPILFDLLADISGEADQQWYQAPYDIREREVCAVSGQPVDRFCNETVSEMFIVGRSPSGRCTVHRPILVDRVSGLRLKASCADASEAERRIIERYSPKVATWLVNNGLSLPLPPYSHDCSSTAAGAKPSILSPEPGSIFTLSKELPSEYQKIRLQASIGAGDGTIHWFVDGKHLVTARATDRTFYLPTLGKHRLICVDEEGRSSSTSIIIEMD